MDKRELRYIRLGIIALVLLNGAGVYRFRALIIEKGWKQISTSLQYAEMLGWTLLLILIGLSIWVWNKRIELVLQWIKTKYTGPNWISWLSFLFVIILMLTYPLLLFGKFTPFLDVEWNRQAIFVWLVVITSAAMAVWRKKSWLEMLPFAAAALAVCYHLATYLPDISNYPFALGWSETTRYYVASTLFDQHIYGMDIPLPFRDFTRYLIQAVPFLVKDSPLWLHRFWQAALRFSSTYFAGYLIARRYQIKGREWVALFSAWAGLYFFEGPVFYNLMVNVLLVYWLVKPKRFWKSLTAVIGISVWAGLSRINWIPMPGLMAAAFYMLETPVVGKDLKSLARYLWKPVLFILVGSLVGIGVYRGYALLSGNPEEIYYASFTSYLLWDRLLPNPSYRLGILPHVLLLTVPLLTYLGMVWWAWKKRWHFIRPLGLLIIIVGLFAGGLLVSVKIGGGTNLHNMDVYFVILLLIAAEVFFGRVVDMEGVSLEIRMPGWLKAAVFAVPIFFVISYGGGPIPVRDMDQAQNEIELLQDYVDQSAEDGGEVLFISQRHLITFGYIENVFLVHDHEKLLLQEMAMSRNTDYLERFGRDLAEQRYTLIVNDSLPLKVQDEETTPLAAENNLFITEISPLIACAYKETGRLLGRSLVLFEPKNEVSCMNIVE